MTVIAHYDDLLPYRWQTFRALDGSFSAQFPSKPKVEGQPLQSATGGNAILHEVTATPTKNTFYACTYLEDARLASESPEELLNSARDGSVSKVQGSIIGEQRLEFHGHAARDVQVRARGNSLLNMRLVADGRRVFILMVVETGRQQTDSKNVRKFFDSLTLSE